MPIAFDPRLYQGRETVESRRKQIVSILQAALTAVDPGEAVRR